MDSREFLTKLLHFCMEIGRTMQRFFALGDHELSLGHGLIVLDSLDERREGRRDLWTQCRRRGWIASTRIEISPDRGALATCQVVQRVHRPGWTDQQTRCGLWTSYARRTYHVTFIA
jgi:hypothetical protein